jgi:7,8-dihydropterin-6-yl-methyl-4-(beta-D-ribofuranosyl)aminobenzene 5'-phosphate synthase
MAASLCPVDAVEALVLVDNVTDSLSTVPPGVVNENVTLRKAGMTEMSGEAKCCAHHGLSLVLAIRSGDEVHHVMFDAGPEAYTVQRNGALLGVPFKDIEDVALSHGHWDHGGGLVEAVRLICAAQGGRRVRVHVNEGMFVERAGRLPDGAAMPMKDVPKPHTLQAAGAEVISSPESRLIGSGFFFLSGDIPRVTSYEKGLASQLKRSADGHAWEPDPWIQEERYLAVNVKNKGMIVFSMCSHAGIVNVLKNVRELFDGIPIHAVMGGFHLAGQGVEAIIPDTILDLLSFGLKRIVPAHCTGWRAFTALANACDEGVLLPSAVGRTFAF